MTASHNLPHWNYFRILEKDLEECFRYIEPSKVHFSVYSDEFAKLILVACSEIENALRELSTSIDKSKICNNLGDYRNVVISKYPYFPMIKICVARYGISVAPWENWATEDSPDWWKNGYNKIKHDRVGNPSAATLERAINSIAALEAVLLYLYKEKHGESSMPSENAPHLMEPIEEGGGASGGYIAWCWELPDDEYAIQKRTKA